MFSIVKHNITGQVTTMNLDFFANSKEEKYLIRKVLEVYLRTKEPTSNVEKFTIIQRTKTHVTYVNISKNKTMILVGSAGLTEKDLVIASSKIKKEISMNKSRFFIHKY